MRATRVVAALLLVMCSVTWVAQAVSSVVDGKALVARVDAEDGQPRHAALPEAVAIDCEGSSECERASLVALDETHDVKLFHLREFTHLFLSVTVRMARNRDLAAILRRPSETFRPPDAATAGIPLRAA